MEKERSSKTQQTEHVLDSLKTEVAQELGLDDDIQDRGWKNMTTKEVGSIGGNMTKKLVEKAESEIAEKQ